MLVRQFMHTNCVTVKRDDSLKRATSLMKQHGFRRLPVLEESRLVGLVADRDVRLYITATAADARDAHAVMEKTRVTEVMTRDPLVLSPDLPLEEAARILRERGVGGAPVLQNGSLVGIITLTDILDVFLTALAARQAGLRLHIRSDVTRLPSLHRVLSEKGIQLHALMLVADTPGDAVLRVSGEDPAAALQESGFEIISAQPTEPNAVPARRTRPPVSS